MSWELVGLGCVLAAGAAAAPAQGFPVVRVREVRGRPHIVVNGRILPPTLFFGNNQFGRDDLLLQEARLAAAAGVRVLSFNLMPPWLADGQTTGATIARFLAAHPEAYLYPRVWAGPPRGWLAAHPGSLLRWGEPVTQEPPPGYGEWASPASSAWQADAERQVRALLRWFESSPYASRLIGLCLLNLNTGEWFYPWGDGFPGYGEDDHASFGRWLARRYASDAALATAWQRTGASLATPTPPPPEERRRGDLGRFLQGGRGRWVRDFHEFQSDAITDSILGLARSVKDESRGRLLVGVFGAYTVELNGNGPNALINSGQLTFRRVATSPHVDILHSPYSYFDRRVGEPAHFPQPVDSLRLHGKLGIFEDDTYTHLAIPPARGLMAPGYNERTTTLAETLAVLRRNFGRFFAHRGQTWVMDLLSDGRWAAPEVWHEHAWLARLAETPTRDRVRAPQVAVVIDEQSCLDLCSTTWPLLYHSLYAWRWEWDRLGASVGTYWMDDLGRIPESARLLIFPNAYRITARHQAALRRRFQRGGRVLLFTYAPGVVAAGGISVSDTERLCGIRLAMEPAEAPLCVRVPAGSLGLSQELRYGDRDARWSPAVWADDPRAQVLGRVEGSGRPGLALREWPGWTAVYSAAPRVPVPILRHLCERAGVHLYLTPAEDGLAPACGLSVDEPYLFLHTDAARRWRVRLRRQAARLERLEPEGPQVLARNTREWVGELPAHETVVLRIVERVPRQRR